MSAVDAVETEVRELVRRRGLDPAQGQAQMRLLIDEVVGHYDERALTSSLTPLTDPRQAARAVYDAVAGFGPLQRHLENNSVEEIWINAPGWVGPCCHSDVTLAAQGMSNEQLFLSPLTAKTHVKRAITKLGVRDRAQLVVIAHQTGLVRAGH